MRYMKRFAVLLLTVSVILTAFSGCNSGGTGDSGADTVLGSGSSVLRIISGSENAELEPILEDFAKRENIRIEMTYQGSLDIMRLLEKRKSLMTPCGPPAACGCRLAIRDTGSNMRNRYPLHRWCSASGKAWRRSWGLQDAKCRSTICFGQSKAESFASV